MNRTKKYEQDFTQGPLAKQILFFSIPLMFTNVLQILFNMADIAVVGRFAGTLALGSVGSTATLVTLFTGLLIGISSGVNVLVAHHLGAKNEKEHYFTIYFSYTDTAGTIQKSGTIRSTASKSAHPQG